MLVRLSLAGHLSNNRLHPSTMPHAYSEDTLVEQPAVELLAEMGWQTIRAFDEVFGDGGTLGRENAGDVVLLRHLIPALKKLNPKAPADAIDAAVNELTRDRSVNSSPVGSRIPAEIAV